MVQIDHRIPLQIQQPNVLAALDAGTQAAGNHNAFARAVEGQNLFRQHGAGAMQGNPNALAAIAGFDPTISQGIAATNLDMDATRLDMDVSRARIQQIKSETARALEAAQDQAQAQREAQEAIRLSNDAFMAFKTGDTARWNQITGLMGASDVPMDEEGVAIVGAIAAGASAFEAARGVRPEPDYTTIEGQLVDRNAPGGPAVVPVAGMSGGPSVDLGEVDKFRKEFMGTPGFKDFDAQAQATARIMEAALNPTSGGESDIALIFNYMKLLDPGSTVREGEFATASQVGGAAQQFVSLYNQIIDGSRLTPQQRAGFADAAQGLYSASEQRFMDTYRQFEAIAQTRGYPINQALIDPRYRGQMPAPPPPPVRPPPPAVTPPAPGAAPAPTQPTPSRRDGRKSEPAQDFSTMNEDDLEALANDPERFNKMSVQELRAFSERLDQLAEERQAR